MLVYQRVGNMFRDKKTPSLSGIQLVYDGRIDFTPEFHHESRGSKWSESPIFSSDFITLLRWERHPAHPEASQNAIWFRPNMSGYSPSIPKSQPSQPWKSCQTLGKTHVFNMSQLEIFAVLGTKIMITMTFSRTPFGKHAKNDSKNYGKSQFLRDKASINCHFPSCVGFADGIFQQSRGTMKPQPLSWGRRPVNHHQWHVEKCYIYRMI